MICKHANQAPKRVITDPPYAKELGNGIQQVECCILHSGHQRLIKAPTQIKLAIGVPKGVARDTANQLPATKSKDKFWVISIMRLPCLGRQSPEIWRIITRSSKSSWHTCIHIICIYIYLYITLYNIYTCYSYNKYIYIYNYIYMHIMYTYMYHD